MTDSIVTVIVPVAEQHLGILPRAIYSLEEQTYKPEILIVNDSTFPIREHDCRILSTGGNKGSAYARNMGLQHVRTPLVSFLDADDYFLNTAIETMVRAYAEYKEACYIYTDWYQYGRNGYFIKKEAKNYDRLKQLRHSLHLVNILIPTEIARTVSFNTSYRGWEDWEFHIRLGQNGFCGVRVPEPLLIYDMTTSINREKHNSIQHEVYSEILEQYQPFLKGEMQFMPCSSCGGSSRSEARKVVMVLPPPAIEGFELLEWLGNNSAPVTYRIKGKVYRGSNDEAFKFIQVPKEDVEDLLKTGMWRKVPRAATATIVPTPSDFNEWRKAQPPVEIPENLKEFFKKDNRVSDEPTVHIQVPPPKRKGRPKGSKNRPKVIATIPEPVVIEEENAH